jgi:azurin
VIGGRIWAVSGPLQNGSDMNSLLKLLPLAVCSLLLGGCGGQNPSTSASSGAATPSGPREIDITGNDTMHYNLTSIAAKPGEQLKVVFTNEGNSPIQVTGHNWILLKAGSDAAAFALAAAAAQSTNYVPPSLQDEILAKIDILGPRKSGEVTFIAPAAPGDYPYLCSFPAHYQVGMHGVLAVK